MGTTTELKQFAKDLSILIVEDDKSLNKELVEIASLFFKDVYSAFNGLEALKIYEAHTADVVVTDITMPKMNGIDLSRKIKYINSNQSIIIVSAHCHLDYLTDIIDIGVKQFIRKPFDDEEFLYRLLKVCEDIVLTKAISQYNSKETNKLTKEEIVIPEAKQTKTKVSADTFLDNMNHDIQLDILYLLELSEDFETYINLIYLHTAREEYLLAVSSILSKMYTTLSQMQAMSKMSQAIFQLVSFLENINYESLSEQQVGKLAMLEFIYQDIEKFLRVVFVQENAKDIHYLEDSLNISIEQLKQNILETDFEEEELELF